MKAHISLAAGLIVSLSAWSGVVLARQQSSIDAPYRGSGLTRQQIMDELTAPSYRTRASTAEGRKVFQSSCSSCHVFKDIGVSGRDLSTIGTRFRKRDILDAILWPSKRAKDSNGARMPEGVVAPLTLQQIDSLVAFLLTGK